MWGGLWFVLLYTQSNAVWDVPDHCKAGYAHSKFTHVDSLSVGLLTIRGRVGG